jgi:hypothetical protein
VQYLCNNLENAKDEILYKTTEGIEYIRYHQGSITVYEDILGLCDYLDKLKVATEEDKKMKEKILKTDPYQAIVEGQTHFEGSH